MSALSQDHPLRSFLQDHLAQVIHLIEKHSVNPYMLVEKLREQIREDTYSASIAEHFRPFLLQSCHLLPNLCKDTLERYLQLHGLPPPDFLSGVAPSFDSALVPTRISTAGSGYILYLKEGLNAEEILFLVAHAYGHLALGHLRRGDLYSHYDVLADLHAPAGPQRRWDRVVLKYQPFWYQPLLSFSEFSAIEWSIPGFAEAVERLQGQDLDDIGWFITSLATHAEQKLPMVDAHLVRDAELFPHQKRGAAELMVRLQRLGGALLADSVGLGKTRTVATTIKLLQKHQIIKQAAVLAPFKLHHNWEAELQKLCLKVGEPGEIDADVIIVNKDIFKRLSTVEACQLVHDCQLLVIEEAHQDMRNLANKFHRNIRAAALDRYGLLVTATPWNNRRGDIFALLQPFLSHRPGTERPMDIFGCFSMGLKKGLQLFEQNSEIFRQVYAHTTLQRTRRQLRESGDTQVFYAPRRPHLIPVNYPSAYHHTLASLLSKIEQLRLPTCNLLYYLNDQSSNENRLSGIHRFRLFKRAESSMYAFARSLDALKQQAHHLSNELLQLADDDAAIAEWLYKRYQLVENQAYEVAALEEDISPPSRSEQAKYSRTQKAIDLAKTQKGRLRNLRYQVLEDCSYEIQLLQGLQREFQPLFKNDPKMEIIVQYIQKAINEEQKVLCISQYVDTAFALYERILGDPLFLRRGIGLVTSSSREGQELVQLNGRSATREDVLSRFAPNAWTYGKSKPQKKQGHNIQHPEEIDILIGSDTLSIGQNLQDARILLNLDLCWNPMQHEQRIGRIDRPRHSQDVQPLDIYYFLNLDIIEAELQLQATLKRRLAGTYQDTAFDDEVFPGYFEMIERFRRLRQKQEINNTYIAEADHILEQIAERSASPSDLPQVTSEQEQEALLQLQELATHVHLSGELSSTSSVRVNIGRVPWLDVQGDPRSNIPTAILLAEIQFQQLNHYQEPIEHMCSHTFYVVTLEEVQEEETTRKRLFIQPDFFSGLVDGLKAETSTITLSHTHIEHLHALLQYLEKSIQEELQIRNAVLKRSNERLATEPTYMQTQERRLSQRAATLSARLLNVRLLI